MDASAACLSKSGEQIAFEFHTNVVLIIISIFLGNAADHARTIVKKDPSLRCRPLIRLLTDFPEATLATMLGAIMGLILSHGFGIQVKFSDGVFFYFILPPIIFYQGYSLKKRNFFRYFHYILTLGVGGTLLQYGILIISVLFLNKLWFFLHLPLIGWGTKGLELSLVDVCFLCSVLTSADEVAALAIIKKEEYPKLSAVLFGEGVLNDAVSILLFRTVLSGQAASSFAPLQMTWRAVYLMTISLLVGSAIGLLISRFLKVNSGLLEHPTRQTIIIMCGCYISYAASEMVNVPGVLSVFVCGVIFSHYAWHSLAPEAKVGTAIFSHSLSTIAETYSFTALGLSIYRFETADWSLRFNVIAIIALVISRFVVVFGIFCIGKLLTRSKFNMSFQEQAILFFAGLIRGAITWAQALQIPGENRRVMISTCLTVISFTLVVVGGAMPSILRALGFESSDTTDVGEIEGIGHARKEYAEENGYVTVGGISRAHSVTPPGIPPALTNNRTSWEGVILHGAVHKYWAHLDEKIKPFFGGRSRLEATSSEDSPLGSSGGSFTGPYGTMLTGPESAGMIDPVALAALNATHTRSISDTFERGGSRLERSGSLSIENGGGGEGGGRLERQTSVGRK